MLLSRPKFPVCLIEILNITKSGGTISTDNYAGKTYSVQTCAPGQLAACINSKFNNALHASSRFLGGKSGEVGALVCNFNLMHEIWHHDLATFNAFVDGILVPLNASPHVGPNTIKLWLGAPALVMPMT